MQQRYALGASTLLDLLTSQSQLNQARAALIQARQDYRIARAVTRAMVPTAGDYLITTFFYPPLLRGRTDVLEFPVDDPAVMQDVDTPDDYRRVFGRVL